MDFRRVNVYMNDLCMGSKLTYFARYPVIKTQADANNQVSNANGLVDMGRAVHTRHTKSKRMGLRQGTQTKQRSDNRNVSFFSKGK